MHTRLFKPLQGKAELLTGDFSRFTRYEAQAIGVVLNRSPTLVMLYDRDRFAVPVNERATWIRRHFNYNPKLEVRALYDAPSISSDNHTSVASYIQKQIPPAISVSAVACDQPYSAALAKALHASHKPTLCTDLMEEIEEVIQQSKLPPYRLLTDVSAPRVLNGFKTPIDENEIENLVTRDKKVIHYTLRAHNMMHPNADTMFERTAWDLRKLRFRHLPIIVGKVFTEPHQRDFSHPNKFQASDMLIYMPDQGWKIPTQFRPLLPIIARIVSAESTCNPALADCYAYITIDSGIVYPGTYARRAGLHVDNFLTDTNAALNKDGIVWADNTYIVSDAEELQTEFYPGPFHLDHVDIDSKREVSEALTKQGKVMTYKQAHAYDIVRLTADNVHAAHLNTTPHAISRSFLKITFSQRLFNHAGFTVAGEKWGVHEENFHARSVRK